MMSLMHALNDQMTTQAVIDEMMTDEMVENEMTAHMEESTAENQENGMHGENEHVETPHN